MILQPALEIFGVYDRGVPNQERIVLRVNSAVDLANYSVLLGFQGAPGSFFPLRDNYFWLGDSRMDMPGWVFLFTGPGKPAVSQESVTNQPLHLLYWNKRGVILNTPNIVPALVQFGSVMNAPAQNKSLDDLSSANQAEGISVAEILKTLGNSLN